VAGDYSRSVIATNALGGLGFLAAAVFFIRRYVREPQTEDMVFISHTLLFGTASLFFGFSHVWAADWWVWHGARLLAYAIVLAAAQKTVVALYQHLARSSQELLKANEDLRTEIVERQRVEVEVARQSEEQARLNAALTRSNLATLNLMQDAVQAKDRLEKVNQELQLEIAERKRAEDILKKTLLDLERSNKELEQFAYVASHDLQEPLRMVASYTQLLEKRYKDQLDQDAKDFIGFAADGANRMQRLINDLLAYSRVGTRGKPLEPTDCHTVLGQAIVNLSTVIEENHAIVTSDQLPKVMADASQMVQLLQNLVGNAIKFRGEESPRIHVSAQEKGNEWVFSVKDNGIGIEAQFSERIFIAFQRLHSREKYPGTGIGLAICKKIVDRHGGKIWIESELGKGSTFYFTTPKRGSVR
jgi:signal transduction histidine kinase